MHEPGRAAADPYRELFERSADAILVIDGDRFVECNDATVRMLRYQDKAELLRAHPSELSPPLQPDGRSSYEKANEMMATAFERGSHRFEWDHVRADGEIFPVEVLLTAVERDGKRMLHVVWRDITERKRLEEELRQAQRMEAVGRLAGGIAHDFNNVLVTVLLNAGILVEELADRPELQERVREIRGAGDRAAALVRQLLTFSRKRALRPRVFDFGAVLGDLWTLLRRLIGEHIRLETSIPDEPVPILADPGQIEQVVVNLAANARDAMPHGGDLRIELAAATAPDGSGPAAVLTVTDTGVGMDEATRKLVFDPFFTTKEVGRGTGLGLSTVYEIVTRSGGTVDIDSRPGAGTTVRVHLPLAPHTAAVREPAAHEHPAMGGTETILVVEDEDAVSDVMLEVLRGRGYSTIRARDGLEALERWRERSAAIELVVADVVMRRMGGAELLEHLRREGFGGPVLFVSGYTNQSLLPLSSLGEEVDLLDKPFTAAQLVARVRRALDGPGRAASDRRPQAP